MNRLISRVQVADVEHESVALVQHIPIIGRPTFWNRATGERRAPKAELEVFVPEESSPEKDYLFLSRNLLG